MLLDDGHVVHRETVRTDAGADIGIVVRFGSSGFRPGTQFHDGKQGWFCAYVVMKDEDFDRISGKLSYRCGYPELDVPGGTSYFSRIPPFDEDGSGPGTMVIRWDYNHDEPMRRMQRSIPLYAIRKRPRSIYRDCSDDHRWDRFPNTSLCVPVSTA